MPDYSFSIFVGLLFFGLFVCLGLSGLGSNIKYGMTRQACITEHMTAQQCSDWNNLWEALGK